MTALKRALLEARGHLQQQHDYGFDQAIGVSANGFTQSDAPLFPVWFRVKHRDRGSRFFEIAIQVYTDEAQGTQVGYGHEIVDIRNMEEGASGHTFTLYWDDQTVPESDGSNPWPDGNTATAIGDLHIDWLTAESPVMTVGYAYLEWWFKMLWNFAQRVKDKMEGATWSADPDEYLLLADDDPERMNARIKTALLDSLCVVHSMEEAEPGPGFDGGFGRNGRALTVRISFYVRNRTGMDVNDEEAAVGTLDTYLEECRDQLYPSGVPDLLDGFIYYGTLAAEQGPAPEPEIGGGVYRATMLYTGYKMEV